MCLGLIYRLPNTRNFTFDNPDITILGKSSNIGTTIEVGNLGGYSEAVYNEGFYNGIYYELFTHNQNSRLS